jgi:hypothetical protein
MGSKKRKPEPPKARTHEAQEAPPFFPENDSSLEVTDEANLKPWVRRLVSVLIVAFLATVVLGPLSNPIASRHLTAPLAAWVSPVHRALFLGHGYRFFAPNPGPSHLVQYKITRADGTQLENVFPDRETITPRLLYHRWFMLSETVYSEHAQTPSPREFERVNLRRLQQVKALKQGGRLVLARSLEETRQSEEVAYQQTLKRIEVLVRSIANFLLEREGGEEIELTVVTRTLPFPTEVRQGADLDEDRFLQYEANAVIGRFSKADFASTAVPSEPNVEEVHP